MKKNMKSKQGKLKGKARKNINEAKFERMVSEYHAAKDVLESMEKGTAEYDKQSKHCDSLFASAERFFTQNQ
jgi:hypothetical protein